MTDCTYFILPGLCAGLLLGRPLWRILMARFHQGLLSSFSRSLRSCSSLKGSQPKNQMSIEEFLAQQKKTQHRHKECVIAPYIWATYGIAEPQREYQFTPERKFRIDYAWPDIRLAVEIEGGYRSRKIQCHKCHSIVEQICSDGVMRPVLIGGAHVGARYLSDMEKYNLLSAGGWALLRYVPNKIDYDEIKKTYEARCATQTK